MLALGRTLLLGCDGVRLIPKGQSSDCICSLVGCASIVAVHIMGTEVLRFAEARHVTRRATSQSGHVFVEVVHVCARNVRKTGSKGDSRAVEVGRDVKEILDVDCE